MVAARGAMAARESGEDGMKLGLVGATGWLGAALGTRALHGGWPVADFLMLNRSAPRGAYARWPDLRWMTDAAALCRAADGIILSVRPGDFPMPGYDGAGKLVISFMAGWSLARLQALHPGGRVVRAMPNGGAVTGQSFTPWVAGAGVDETDRALTRRLLAAIGDEAEVTSEDQLDYLSALSGSGAAYPALMAQAMLAHARAEGLPEEVALRAVGSVLASGAALAADPAAIDALLATYHGYRGITDAGLKAATAAGLPAAVSVALTAARDHALRMTRDGA
jgi:pyrroline-5-carboxylate reductase